MTMVNQVFLFFTIRQFGVPLETFLRPIIALTCDETRYTKFGAISAPVDMDGNYKDNIDCTWTIISRYDGGMITVKVTEMDIISPNIGTCEQDYLQVRIEWAM